MVVLLLAFAVKQDNSLGGKNDNLCAGRGRMIGLLFGCGLLSGWTTGRKEENFSFSYVFARDLNISTG